MFGAKRRSFGSARSAGVYVRRKAPEFWFGAKRWRSFRREAPTLNVVQEKHL
jgi:hypothetical protein